MEVRMYTHCPYSIRWAAFSMLTSVSWASHYTKTFAYNSTGILPIKMSNKLNTRHDKHCFFNVICICQRAMAMSWYWDAVWAGKGQTSLDPRNHVHMGSRSPTQGSHYLGYNKLQDFSRTREAFFHSIAQQIPGPCTEISRFGLVWFE